MKFGAPACGYNHAGNLGVVLATEAGETEACDTISKAMRRVSLQIHCEVRATCDAETLEVRGSGHNLDGARMAPPHCREFARRKRACRRRHEHCMNHLTLFRVCWRMGSSLFLFTSCKLPRVPYLDPLHIWSTVRGQLEALVPCLEANHRLP